VGADRFGVFLILVENVCCEPRAVVHIPPKRKTL
jgi:hypothetical protein